MKEKNNALWRVDYFSFEGLDKFIWLFQLADMKRQETKQTYYVDKSKINTTGINDDCITTERPAANTRLSDNSRIRAILEFHHPHYLHRGATVKAPAIRLLRLASVVMANSRKRKKTTVKHENRRKFQNFISLTNSGQELKKTFRNN